MVLDQSAGRVARQIGHGFLQLLGLGASSTTVTSRGSHRSAVDVNEDRPVDTSLVLSVFLGSDGVDVTSLDKRQEVVSRLVAHRERVGDATSRLGTGTAAAEAELALHGTGLVGGDDPTSAVRALAKAVAARAGLRGAGQNLVAEGEDASGDVLWHFSIIATELFSSSTLYFSPLVRSS